MNTLATMININLIISILLALVIFQFVLTPLHRLVSCFIYRNVMVKREVMAKAGSKTAIDAEQSKERIA